MPKRGRPRKTRPEIDLGTPELQKKRLAALRAGGPARPNWPVPDPSAAENALSVMLWQGLLHSEYHQAKRMHDAGIMFAGWWVLIHPMTFAQGTLGRFQPGGSSNVETESVEANLKSTCALLARDRAVLDAVVNAAVYQQINLRQIDKLRAGLCRLVEWRKQRSRPVNGQLGGAETNLF